MIKNENINLLTKKFNENKLAHVFLIETNDKNATFLDILELIKVINCPKKEYEEECFDCNLCHLIQNLKLPSLRIINPDGQAIKKSQMEELKNSFTSVPYLSRYNAYIINDAEKFNSSSANTILKFIEEPEKNIIGFLITNNKENVISTIKSRCEIVKALYNEEVTMENENIQNLAYEYLYKLEVEKHESIVYNKTVLEEKLEKNELLEIFKIILGIYLNLLNEKEIPFRLEALKKLEKSALIDRIVTTSEIIERLNFNVNTNLLLDYFVLRLEDY